MKTFTTYYYPFCTRVDPCNSKTFPLSICLSRKAHVLKMHKDVTFFTKCFNNNLRYLRKILLIWVIFCAFKSLNADDSWIDQYHLREFPYCGSMYHLPHEYKGRVANAQAGKKYYRWTVLVATFNIRNQPGKTKTTYCGGTVITDRQERILIPLLDIQVRLYKYKKN